MRIEISFSRLLIILEVGAAAGAKKEPRSKEAELTGYWYTWDRATKKKSTANHLISFLRSE